MQEFYGRQILYLYYDTKSQESVVVDTSGCRYRYTMNCLRLVKRLCKLYGTTFAFQMAQNQQILSAKQKIPVVIKESKQYILFPTTSIERNDCIWFNYAYIVKVVDYHYTFSLIHFSNGSMFCIRINIRVLKKQLHRCMQIEQHLKIL